MKYRIEKDSMGEIKVSEAVYWGAQTQRSFNNFKIGKEIMPIELIRALAHLKKACARANFEFGKLSEKKCLLIEQCCDEIISKKLDGNFPLKIFQTGSGTQSNMNINEVIANRGNEIASEKILHPNDDVNMSQSSNDTFPTAMHIAAIIEINKNLLPSIESLINTFKDLENKYDQIVKIGRTHLQDATPIKFSQEISAWRNMLEVNKEMIIESNEGLLKLAIGGTAVGTGINAPNQFGEKVCEILRDNLGYKFLSEDNKFHGLTSKDYIVYSHGAIKATAVNLMKIGNDIRWLASGPRCGLGEINIPSNEPGSSIMPGKVNPTQSEALTMVCVQVMGNDATIGFAASQGNFQLNVFMPVIIYNYLQSVGLLADAINSFNEHCAVGIVPNEEKMDFNLHNSLMLVTALNPKIGYDNSAKVAKYAFNHNCSLKEAAIHLNLLTEEEFDLIVKPNEMV
ncbi:class II fumarate hydratase [Anaerosphaera multitolerans]|uniref:Fumarate hydratase class II n=1 Tax=Anaerosphaera multitolerans TaxID=2487351 RepID=A0A437S544_9FIRM|nr:class II fumarate hydratase [Anaerosphaera multitolerans]RVU54143.1 class II fumarate hydratase [Anaerosphaera multitolerans]